MTLPFVKIVKILNRKFIILLKLWISFQKRNPTLRMSSSPPLSEGDIATLLATGSTSGDLRSSEGMAANRAARQQAAQRMPRAYLYRVCADAGHNPSCCQMSSTRAFTSGAITIGVPHSRLVSPGHLLVASMPILLPRPLIGDAKSR